jgi:hypothetical protein
MPFVKGASGNPSGRPKGSKNKLTDVFWRDCCQAWEKHGIAAIETMATEEPVKFVQMFATALPREDKLDIVHTMVARMPADPASIEDWEKRNIPHVSQH